ncbi:hypothetical protein SUGI_0212270 [Cryptomeria japonica]|nr:hypothetical protein SUGI_0212270 [Cryptomeria japonica]
MGKENLRAEGQTIHRKTSCQRKEMKDLKPWTIEGKTIHRHTVDAFIAWLRRIVCIHLTAHLSDVKRQLLPLPLRLRFT